MNTKYYDFGWVGVILLTFIVIAIIAGVFIGESAIFQWFWNDFLVTHSNHLFARASLPESMLPVLVISLFRGSYYTSKGKNSKS